MLFNSYTFLVHFLPIAFLGFFAFGVAGQRWLAITWLTIVSIIFYGWWTPHYVPLLLTSIVLNYAVGWQLRRHRSRGLFLTGVAANLLLLGYYKYAAFAVLSLDQALGLGWTVPHIVLPLAISFFTFQQIAFLSDSYDQIGTAPSFANYCMFITFFPHLIAGPITHHREIIPQFEDGHIFRPQPHLITLGATVFLMGLFKKVILADNIAVWANPVFASAADGNAIQLQEAWGGALCYALQIYFDFSGYSDMAIGLGLLFGVRLPFNFSSPFKARNIIDFWARWHMTLTRFVTAYMYNPLAIRITHARLRAGKPVLKRGKTTFGAFVTLVAIPPLVSMFLIGVWHGAGWQFAAFGLLHGTYLTINHGWRILKARWKWTVDSQSAGRMIPSCLLTFACVIIGLVFFRAADLHNAWVMLAGMFGLHGASLHFSALLTHNQIAMAGLLLVIVWGLPNTQQWMRSFETGIGAVTEPKTLASLGGPARYLGHVLTWKPTPAYAVITGLLGFVALMKAMSAAPTEFLYFQF